MALPWAEEPEALIEPDAQLTELDGDAELLLFPLELQPDRTSRAAVPAAAVMAMRLRTRRPFRMTWLALTTLGSQYGGTAKAKRTAGYKFLTE
jgi:hypothetical protein